MVVLSVILGVLLIIVGFSCIFTPLATFLATGYLLGIILLVYGIAGIIRSFGHKADVLEWILNILSIVVGVVAIIRPGNTLVFDGIILILIACWLLAQGIIQIILAFKTKSENKGWYWGLIVGILAVLLGILAFLNPTFTAVTAGILVGFFFVEAGISLISMGVAFGSNE